MELVQNWPEDNEHSDNKTEAFEYKTKSFSIAN